MKLQILLLQLKYMKEVFLNKLLAISVCISYVCSLVSFKMFPPLIMVIDE